MAVNNIFADRMVQIWKSKNANISTFQFDAKLQLVHDLIDPNTCGDKIESVYPKLIELVRH